MGYNRGAKVMAKKLITKVSEHTKFVHSNETTINYSVIYNGVWVSAMSIEVVKCGSHTDFRLKWYGENWDKIAAELFGDCYSLKCTSLWDCKQKAQMMCAKGVIRYNMVWGS